MADDYMETAARGGGIRTRGKWADFQLHVEWASPTPPKGTGQERGNSGILINEMYEVQVLDSYQAKTYPDGQAGAIYGQEPPLVNASKAPGEWQTYDIIFEPPRWNDQGELTKKAIVTVIHNGVVVQNHYELTGMTDGINGARCLGNRCRNIPNRMRWRFLLNCKTIIIPCATVISGFAPLVKPTSREGL